MQLASSEETYREGTLVEATLAGLMQESTLPPEFEKFAAVALDLGDEPFPTETRTRHAIPLIEGETTPYGPIYPLNAKEL